MKLVLEIDLTEALKHGELGPGYGGCNEHNWTEEQEKYIVGFVLRHIGELITEDANVPCLDYMDYDDMDAPEGMFKSHNYDESVVEDSPEDNLMDAQESALSVGLEIGQVFLVEAKARGLRNKFEPQEVTN